MKEKFKNCFWKNKKHWRRGACVIAIILSCSFALAMEYDAGDPIASVSITYPTADTVWAAGSTHELTCTNTSEDWDRQRENSEDDWENVEDSVTYYWTGPGTFEYNDNIGTSVTYTCTTSPCYNVVTVHADDNYDNTAIVNDDPASDSQTTPAVQVQSVTVDSGAVQRSVTGAKNWAAVKAATGDVIVKATLNPNVNNVPAEFTWEGGTAVEGQPLQRKVSKATSAKTTVTASCGGASDHVDVWILWATVTIKMAGTTPPNAKQFGTRFDGTENLGAVNYTLGVDPGAAGKVVAYAVITPAGVHNVVTGRWTFDQDRWSHDFEDGVKVGGFWDANWTTDSINPNWAVIAPDANDKIYYNDAPTIARFDATDSSETYNNFRDRIKWDGTPCSDYSLWYFKGRWKSGAAPVITLKAVGGGSIALPAENAPHYPAP